MCAPSAFLNHHLLQFAIPLNPFVINIGYFAAVHVCLPEGRSSDSADFLQASLNKPDLVLDASTQNTIAFPLETNKNKAHLYYYDFKAIHFARDKGHVFLCTGLLFKIKLNCTC